MKLSVTPNDNIQNLLDQIPLSETIHLYLADGFYYQKLTLRHPNMIIEGESHDAIITHDDHALKFHQDGLLMNTFRTQTVLVVGDSITLRNLTILNTSGKGEKIGQAIALSSYGDNTVIDNCVLKSTQDTVFFGPLPEDLCKRYTHILAKEELSLRPLKHFVFRSTIEGDIDFIFGSSDAFFDNCTIISNGNGYITAPSTHPKSSFGLVFNDCIFQSKGDFKVILGRPWRSGGSSIFIHSKFRSSIDQNRFDDWSKPFYHFYETPYVSSIHSKPLPEAMLNSILEIIANKR